MQAINIVPKQAYWYGLLAMTHNRNNDKSVLNASQHWTAPEELGGATVALVKNGAVVL